MAIPHGREHCGNSKYARVKKLILILSLLPLPLLSHGQLTQTKFEKTIVWINQNPSESDTEDFVSKSADLIKFQLFNYPKFLINTSGTRELDKEWKDHKYESYF